MDLCSNDKTEIIVCLTCLGGSLGGGFSFLNVSIVFEWSSGNKLCNVKQDSQFLDQSKMD